MTIKIVEILSYHDNGHEREMKLDVTNSSVCGLHCCVDAEEVTEGERFMDIFKKEMDKGNMIFYCDFANGQTCPIDNSNESRMWKMKMLGETE